MLNEEMVDDDLDSAATAYYGIMQFSDPNERLAVMRNYISALEAKVNLLQVRSRNETAALCRMV